MVSKILTVRNRAGFKSEIKISCDGVDEEDMASAIEKLFENRFEQ
jgi:phosphotransferase system HPr-like phosphotransfer protein